MTERLAVFEHLPRYRGDQGPAERIGELEEGHHPRPGDKVEVAGKTWVVASVQADKITVKPK